MCITATARATAPLRRSLGACLFGLVLAPIANSAWAQIYQCTEDGRMRYQDRPCVAAPHAAPRYRSPSPASPANAEAVASTPAMEQAAQEAEEARARLRALDRTQRMREQIHEIQRERAQRDHELRMRDLRADFREQHEQRMATLKAIEARERAREEAEAARPRTSGRYLPHK
jgi:flagellar biosynthesis GTPase FlhF